MDEYIPDDLFPSCSITEETYQDAIFCKIPVMYEFLLEALLK